MTTELVEQDFLSPYIHSNNNLGIIYRIPNNIAVNIDMISIVTNYIGCEVKQFNEYLQVICIHQGSTRKNIS